MRVQTLGAYHRPDVVTLRAIGATDTSTSTRGAATWGWGTGLAMGLFTGLGLGFCLTMLFMPRSR